MGDLVYPRLRLAPAMVLVEEMRSTFERGGLPAVAALAAVEHPMAAPVATGGRVATRGQIQHVRREVTLRLASWLEGRWVPRAHAPRFDTELGLALKESLNILPADAAHEGTWSFLTLVVLPEIAAVRFPGMHENRLLGRPRNVLRRAWQRADVLGDVLRQDEALLGEDEMTGLFERSSMARNRALVRKMASVVLSRPPDGSRSHWAREFYKRVTFATGPRLLDALSERELDAVIRQAAEEADALHGGSG